MLKHPQERMSVGAARGLRAALIGLLAVGAIIVSGLRGTAAEAPPAASLAASVDRKPLQLAFVPSNAAVVAAIRPAQLLANPNLVEAKQTINEILTLNGVQVLRVENIEQLTLLFMAGDSPVPMPAFILKLANPIDVPAYANSLQLTKEERLVDGKVYYTRAEGAPRGIVPALVVADDTTLIYASDRNVLSPMLTAGASSWQQRGWADSWKKIQDNDAGVAVDMSILRPIVEAAMRNADTSIIQSFSPIWKNSENFVAGASLGEKASASLIASTSNAADATKLKDTIQAFLTLGRNQLAAIRDNTRNRPGDPNEMLAINAMLDVMQLMLDGIQLDSAGQQVTAQVNIQGDATAKTLAGLMPAVTAARAAAARAQSTNNLKQIMLAFHNFHDVHGYFPGSINHVKPGDPGHSWRVAILPYIEAADLYEQYHFDEPWDSPANRRLIGKMPAVLRDPSMPATATSSNYYVFVGGGALCSPFANTKISDILDGTSNTIAVVEAKRDIPWTRPEDIPFDPKQPLPEIGGLRPNGFLAGLADGAVRFFSRDAGEDLIKKMITRAGGEVVNLR